jgi:hypothetical protein
VSSDDKRALDLAHALLGAVRQIAPDHDPLWLLSTALGVSIAEDAWPGEIDPAMVLMIWNAVSAVSAMRWRWLHGISPGDQVGHA